MPVIELFFLPELCIFGFSWAIWRLFILDQTMKAFIGLLICSFLIEKNRMICFDF